MIKAIRIRKAGNPAVMKWQDVDIPAPGRGEAQIKHAYVGLNYIDCYFRSGLYPIAGFPAVIGMEGAGVVEAVGPGVQNVKRGDRVAYAAVLGAYAQKRNIAAANLVKVPKKISDKEAAAMMLKGMTTEYLIRRTYRVKRGDTVLFHAAAGGVGLIACQWLKHLGATVIGTVGSDAKARLAKRHGCDYPINYNKQDFKEAVLDITNGKGRSGGIRFRRQVDLRKIARLPAPAWRHGIVRPVLGTGAQVRPGGTCRAWVALRHAPIAHELQRHAPGTRGQREGAVRRGRIGCRKDQGQPNISTEGRGPRASRSRRPADHRLNGISRLNRTSAQGNSNHAKSPRGPRTRAAGCHAVGRHRPRPARTG